jgi:hypothetical protein
VPGVYSGPLFVELFTVNIYIYIYRTLPSSSFGL